MLNNIMMESCHACVAFLTPVGKNLSVARSPFHWCSRDSLHSWSATLWSMLSFRNHWNGDENHRLEQIQASTPLMIRTFYSNSIQWFRTGSEIPVIDRSQSVFFSGLPAILRRTNSLGPPQLIWKKSILEDYKLDITDKIHLPSLSQCTKIFSAHEYFMSGI